MVDEVARKKPITVAEQIAVDENGRRRFHGAFTGGFSAGYFNTVGSKEGWTPSTFKSSRQDRNKFKSQNVLDFMDDEVPCSRLTLCVNLTVERIKKYILNTNYIMYYRTRAFLESLHKFCVRQMSFQISQQIPKDENGPGQNNPTGLYQECLFWIRFYNRQSTYILGPF